MDVLAVVVMLIALVALAGVVIYFIQDYLKYKDTSSKDLNDVSDKVETEKSDRLSNVKYVVDQVNTVNTDIYNSFSSSNAATAVSLSNVSASQSNMLLGLDKVVKFSSNSSLFKLTDLPGVVAPNIRLMQDVTMAMNFTAQDLNKSGPMAKFCARGDANRCIMFPNSEGDTLIRNLDAGRDLVLQNTDAGRSIRFDGPVSMNSSLAASGRVGIGSTNPTALLDIRATNATDSILKVSTQAGNRIEVTNAGIINIKNAAGTANLATLSPDSAGTGLLLTATNLSVKGNLLVSGNVSSNVQM